MHRTILHILICICLFLPVFDITGQQSLQWIGDSTTYLPNDINIQVSICENGYMFPNHYFEDPGGTESWPDFPLLEGVHFNSDCPNAVFEVLNGPDHLFMEGQTKVSYIITNDCHDTLAHEFIVNIICSTCEGGGIYCSNCTNTFVNGCFTCNIDELLNGFLSCTPEYLGFLQSDQPNPLCFGAGVPHNMSWFAFVAGGTELCVTVQPFQCAMSTGAIGLQSGVYDFCVEDGGVCIGGDAFCSSGLDAIEYSIENLVVGNTYYLFVDGCNGSECDYEITIDKGYEFKLDTPDSITFEAIPTIDTTGFQNIVYSGTKIQLDIHHKGDSPTDSGEFDEPGPYSPDLDAEFYWSFEPAINGIDTGHWNPVIEGFVIPLLTFTDIMDSIDYEICLTEILSTCDEVKCDNCCFEFTVVPQTTSINSINQSNISIYPNPGAGVFKIDNIPFDQFKVCVFDHQLRKVKEQFNNSEIDLSSITQGTYYVIIEDDKSKKIFSRQIVKY